MVTNLLSYRSVVVSGALCLAILWATDPMGTRSSQTVAIAAESDGADSNYPKRIRLEHVPNCIQVTDGVYSGGLPEGEKGFEELQALGVKTIISVDGMTPDIGTAKKFQLRYVHLPHGYDGISTGRMLEIAKGLHTLPKPIFIHCHHGKHRSPAATAAACVTLGWIDQSTANKVLQVAGTNPNYRGLISSVTNARAIPSADLDKVEGKFQEIAAVPPLIETMVAMDEHFEAIAKIDPSLSQDHKSRTVLADRVLLMTDHYTELQRMAEQENAPKEYQNLLKVGESVCVELETELRQPSTAAKPLDVKPLVERLKSNCTSCHQLFRDNRTPDKPQR
ncbi:hypothetical protein VN12_02890 [Pirellula sp. SH-Sr6A]|uniref:hypothetical protein n=1 Tax=Pirellula sp. SH-Sr6A TaxID=1632865 RepID=UPI00078C7A42|nr:hypothetical protein [Pirellula sp. SH-Sr6A]AMV31035.1 hypothetical protein VN12_02890 [Pirellula sp. SH-Sr6A]